MRAFGDAADDKVATLGFVVIVSPSSITQGYTVDFYDRLRELGWVKGKNLLVEERWAEGRLDRMPALMADVVARKVDLILTGTEAGAIAATRATRTIPIVAVALGDPLAAGIVTSLARPGGNLTGLSLQGGRRYPRQMPRVTSRGRSTAICHRCILEPGYAAESYPITGARSGRSGTRCPASDD